MTEFIFMLTYNDMTVKNAIEVYKEIRNTKVKFIGFKDIGLPIDQLKKLVKMMKQDNRTTFLEVVSESKEAAIQSAKTAVKLGVDYLIGGTYIQETMPIIHETEIRFFPYVGKIVDHPCLLRGTIEEIVEDAKRVEKIGAPGINLLAYRYDGDVEKLMLSVQKAVKIPLIVAGSINNYERVRKMKELGIWAFTIGGAIFDKKFVPKGTYGENIEAVLKEIK
ncbi:MAG: HisA/HisF-related TIM barrel protein [Candidatus Jordarchaeum sp.]|uniref:HisA/HisF-related TIM barrel protein n=1 Tax=Candidatus Jordarchaeum sp. TaxID=2823881 RepID=UPI004049B3D7